MQSWSDNLYIYGKILLFQEHKNAYFTWWTELQQNAIEIIRMKKRKLLFSMPVIFINSSENITFLCVTHILSYPLITLKNLQDICQMLSRCANFALGFKNLAPTLRQSMGEVANILAGWNSISVGALVPLLTLASGSVSALAPNPLAVKIAISGSSTHTV